MTRRKIFSSDKCRLENRKVGFDGEKTLKRGKCLSDGGPQRVSRINEGQNSQRRLEFEANGM